MFRLPVCPHCGTVYHYKDIKNEIKQKQDTCYHCKKQFRVSFFPGVLICGGILLILCIALNILVLFRMRDFQLWPLFLITLVFILLLYLLIPFFTSFRKTEDIDNKTNQTKQKPKTKKNNK